MGVGLSLLAPSAPTVAISSYVDILQNMQYIELINNSRFLKTIKAIDNKTGNLVVIKVLIKPPSNYIVNFHDVNQLLIKESSLLSQYCNVLPWHKIIETDRAGYLIRQSIKTNIYDRLSIRPFLEPIEKLFLIFQMLKVIDLIHTNLGIHHGDLKLENFLVTSWNWLMLADFANYTKPTFIPEDNPNQYSFYFDSSGRRVCYVAPERFYNSKRNNDILQNFNDDGKYLGHDKLTDAMDCFSLGCVIAEIYSDGEPTFTLSQLFKYIKGEYSPELSGISDPNIKKIIESLIKVDPDSRPSAATILEEYNSTCFPAYFYDFLYDFMYDLNNNDLFEVPDDNPNISPSDLKIDMIYDNFDKIASHLRFDYEKNSKDVNNELNDELSKSKFESLKLNLKGMPYNYTIKSSALFENSDELNHAALIILNLTFSLIKSLKLPSSKIKACELIVALSERINDEAKLDRSLPYLCSFLDEYIELASNLNIFLEQPGELQGQLNQFNLLQSSNTSSKVACMALMSITTLLSSCSYITPINVLVFPEYLLPKLTSLLTINSKPNDSEQTLVKITLAACLPYLAQISKAFWMMSKTFKNKAVKDYKNRLMMHSNMINGKNMLAVDVNETGNDLLNSYNTFNIPKDQLDSDFENLAFGLLTDFNVNVKISLVNNILPLCRFFGVAKANDIILPHLITYLNDANYQLRLAFLSSILEIGPYVGVLSFEQYLLPLLIQTLGDQEQFVVLKVLEIFNSFVRDRVINPKNEFNALSIYKELLVNSLNLLLHPNEWIRQSVLNLIININDNLLDADSYCFLYPLIKNFLSYDIATINWNTLYPCLTRPISRQVYDATITWCLNASPRSLFWQQRKFATINEINGNKKQQLRVVSFSKNMGKSVYVPLMNGNSRLESDANGNDTGLGNISLSPEDRQWILKLKSVGLDDKDLWKVVALRDYISHTSKSNVNHDNSGAQTQRDFEVAKNANVLPRNIFFEICYKTEPIAGKSKTTETSIDQSTGAEDTISICSRRDSNSLVLPNFGRVKASLQTVEANVFGELELGYENKKTGHSSSEAAHHHIHSTKDLKTSHRVFSVSNQKIISNNLRHSYNGYNPFILDYLHDVEFDPTLENFPEFGKIVKTNLNSNSNRPANGSAKSSLTPSPSFQPKGIVIAHVNTNNSSNVIDGINVVTTGPTSEFFVTGSEMGYLKLWDVSKLEKNLASKNAILFIHLKSAIVDIKFMKDRFVMAVATVDGEIRLFRIDVTRSKNKKIIKYNKLVLIRKTESNDDHPSLNLSSNYLRKLEFMITNTKSYLVGISTDCKIVGYDIIKMEKEFELQNPLSYGTPTSFIIGHNQVWLIIATSEGILSLWDLRFKILIKSWKVNNHEDDGGKYSINKLVLLSPAFSIDRKSSNGDSKPSSSVNSYFAMIGGSKDSDISIWEVPTFQCREIYSSRVQIPKIKQYTLDDIDDDKELSIDEIFSELNIDQFDQENNSVNSINNKSMTALAYFSKFDSKDSITESSTEQDYFVSATWDKKIIVWNLNEVESSISLCNQDESNITAFVKHKVSLSLSCITEKNKVMKQQKVVPGRGKDKHDTMVHMDTITDLDVISKPFEMIVSVDRHGYLNLYK